MAAIHLNIRENKHVVKTSSDSVDYGSLKYQDIIRYKGQAFGMINISNASDIVDSFKLKSQKSYQN